MVGDEQIDESVRCLHLIAPVSGWNASSSPSAVPTYTVPSAPIAGELPDGAESEACQRI
jgi:hypothetical protein